MSDQHSPILRALLKTGPNPTSHRKQVERLRRSWTVLWRALAALLEEYRTQMVPCSCLHVGQPIEQCRLHGLTREELWTRAEEREKVWRTAAETSAKDARAEAWTEGYEARRDRGRDAVNPYRPRAQRPAYCPECGCDTTRPTAIHVLDCGRHASVLSSGEES